jgi:hypothetical protein
LESVGTMVDEDARFIRGNRDPSNFVGADTGEAERFIGAQQSGLGEVIEAAIAEGLESEVAEDANQVAEPVVPPRTLLNAPRLQVGFTSPLPAVDNLNATVEARLQQTLELSDSGRVEVLVEDRVAILRGTVPSERDRKMAGLLAGFEPGISRVRNELTVASSGPSDNATAPPQPDRSVPPLPPPTPQDRRGG